MRYVISAALLMCLAGALQAQALSEHFDTGPALPSGWTDSSTAGANWSVTGTLSYSPTRSVHAAPTTPSSSSSSRLQSPALHVPAGQYQLEFYKHHQLNELGQMKDLLYVEISVAGGAFMPVKAISGAYIAVNPYDVNGGTSTSVDGWTGTTAAFERCVIALPSQTAAWTMQIRFVQVTFGYGASSGSWIDAIEIVPGEPLIALETAAGQMLAHGDTYNSYALIAGTSTTEHLKVHNPGVADLHVSAGTVSSLVNCTATFTAPSSAVAAAWFSLAPLSITATAPGNWSLTLELQSDAADFPVFRVVVQGSATTASTPDIELVRMDTAPTDPENAAPSGSTWDWPRPIAAAVTRTLYLRVRNTGTAALAFSSASPYTVTGLSNCTVVSISRSSAAPPTLATLGGSEDVRVNFQATAAGTWRFVFNVGSNDPDENPYTFTVRGIVPVTADPDIEVRSEGGAVLSSGAATTVSGTSAGSARLVNLPVSNTGLGVLNFTAISVTPTLNCTVAQTATLTYLTAGDTAPLGVSVIPGAGGSWAFAVELTSNDPDESPFTVNVVGSAGAGSAPEVEIRTAAGLSIASGGTLGLGTVGVGAAAVAQLRIHNLGSSDLLLLAPVASVSGATNCSCTPAAPAAGAVAASTNVNLPVTVTPLAAGAFQVLLTIHSNDSDEGSYTVLLQGTAGGGGGSGGSGGSLLSGGGGGGGGGCAAESATHQPALLALLALLLAGAVVVRRRCA